ncbi:MAG: hypothetical protein ACXW2Y_10515 [Acidimicrobiia bacterium]
MWRRYVRPTILVVVCVYVPVGLLLVAAKLAAPDQHASALIEPAFDPGDSLTRGSLWIAGLAGWVLAATACLVGVLAARGRLSMTPKRQLLAGAGLLTLLMLADDLFQLHKPVFPDATGLPSVLLLAIYGLAVATWAWSNRAAIADTDAGVLVVALGFFALWILVKVGPGIPGRISVAAGAKLCGIAGWAAYLTLTCSMVRSTAPPRSPTR